MLMLVDTAGSTKTIKAELNASGKESSKEKISFQLIITVNMLSQRRILD